MDRKFKTNKEQKTPTNPNPKTKRENNTFDIDEKTIKKQQNKS
jgi:hypothetical protein